MDAGSSPALESFVDDVRRYVRRRVDDPAVRDDLVQEVFLRVQGRREQLRDDERLAGWIRRIAANVVSDHYRRRRPAEALPAAIAISRPTVSTSSTGPMGMPKATSAASMASGASPSSTQRKASSM